MFGFLIGTACLIGLIAVLKRGRCGHGRGCGGRCRRGGGWGGHSHGGGGGGFFVNRVFSELDASPGQEKVIRSALEELFEAGRSFKTALHRSRSSIADVLRGETVDETQLGELFAKHDDEIESLRKALVGALARIHDALDERQRKRLAEIIESGPRRWGGPYRSQGWV
jgi:hypothetical protein